MCVGTYMCVFTQQENAFVCETMCVI